MGTFSAVLDRFRRIIPACPNGPLQHRSKSQARSCVRTHRSLFESLEERSLLSVGGLPANVESLLTVPNVPAQYHQSSLGGYLSGPSQRAPLDIAVSYVTAHAADFGLTAADLNSFEVTRVYATEDTGLSHVYLVQTLNGLEVVNAEINVNVTADGRVLSVGSSFVPGLRAQQIVGNVAPAMDAVQALTVMAGQFGWTVDGVPAVISSSQDAARTTVLTPSGVSRETVPAKLVYVPVPTGGAALAWNLVVRTVDYQHTYEADVDASTGELLYLADWVKRASYTTFALPTENPDDGAQTTVTDPADMIASPEGWHQINGTAYTYTQGNNVLAEEDRDGNDGTAGRRADGGADLNFNFTFDPSQDPTSQPTQDAAITNVFYWVNIAHDIHFRYGFTEAAGNFQTVNYTGQGRAGDAIIAHAQDAYAANNAYMEITSDGIAPHLMMGVFELTSPSRDSDFETMIIVHEYGHGVSTRMTGGAHSASSLNALQSGGMGEGWSDWWGLMFTQKSTDAKMDRYPVGNYVLGFPSDGPGIRRNPYSFDMTVNPLTYGDFNWNPEEHDAGEIWCSALWDLNWLLTDQYGFTPDFAQGYDPAHPAGNTLALKLIMDALAIQPVRPSYLDGRDAILQADQILTGGQNQLAIWTAFARRGMGYSANDGGGGNGYPVQEAFDMPPAEIQGMVWNDWDGDGIRDAAEMALAGWTVYLDLNGDSSRGSNEPAFTTGSDGSYSLTVVPGVYTVREVVQPGWVQTAPRSGFYTVELSALETLTGIDFGNQGMPGAISGVVWDDSNGNGVREAFESPLPGWTVFVDLNDDGAFDAGEPSAVSGADGSYSVSGLRPRDYIVREVLQPGWVHSAPADSHSVTVAPNATTPDVDFGNVRPATITGIVWNDFDGDGQKNDGGHVIPANWVVYLDTNNNGRPDTGEIASTEADGSYTISAPPGTYAVRQVLQRDWRRTFPAAESYRLTLVSGQTVEDIDFGNRAYGGISGVVWNDRDTDGVRAGGEALLSGWRVYLDRNGDGQWQESTEESRITDALGCYAFSDLPAGDYTVRQVLQPGWQPNYPSTDPATNAHAVTIKCGQVPARNFGNFDVAPTILGLPDKVTTVEDTPTAAIEFWIDDEETPAALLDVTVRSSNAVLVPNDEAHLTRGGSGNARTLTITPVAGEHGTAEITVTVTDQGGTWISHTFILVVKHVNHAPVLNAQTFTVSPGVLEDSQGGAGTLVADMIASAAGNPITDVDLNAKQGIAVVRTDPNSGTWQYFTDQATGWRTIEGASDTNAYLLFADQTTRIRFVPSPDFFGTATDAIEFRAWDRTLDDASGHEVDPSVNGTTANVSNHGGNAPYSENTATASISVTGVNDAPSFTLLGPVDEVNEDSGPRSVANWARDIKAGPDNESDQTLTFIIVSNDRPDLFSERPTVDPTGKLTYTPAANVFGTAKVKVRLQDNGGTAYGGKNTSADQEFQIVIRPVNDAPSFVTGANPNQTVYEDAGPQTVGAWAQRMSPGPTNESGQSFEFTVSADRTDLFSAQPTIDALTGTLQYTPAASQHGTASVSVQLRDNGGTENGGFDRSDVLTFTITILSVNDPPSFTKGPDIKSPDYPVREDGGPQEFAGWVTEIRAGPANEAAQSVVFMVSADRRELFSAQPAISATGTLTFAPAPYAFGTATVTVQLSDDGGVENGGQYISAAQTFTIEILPVNNAPSFVKGADQQVIENNGPQSVRNWARSISSGPSNEAGQTLTFVVTVPAEDRGLFAELPAIDSATGTLTYRPAQNAFTKDGEPVQVSVRLRDSGGTDHGGRDTSEPQTFTITILPVNNAPSFAKGADQFVDTTDVPPIPGWADPAFIKAGPDNEAGQSLWFVVTVPEEDEALFAELPAIDPATGNLTYRPAPNAVGTVLVSVELRDDGGTERGGLDKSPTQTFAIHIARPLGTIDRRDESAPNPANRGPWYSLQTTRAGYLTAEALDADATMTLHDDNGTIVARSVRLTGRQRIDYVASEPGQTYYLAISGGADPVGLRLANLVSISGSTMTVSGKTDDGNDENDAFEVDATTNRVTINDVVYDFNPVSVTKVIFHGGGGSNTARFLGTTGAEQVGLWPGSALFSTTRVTVEVVGAATITAESGGGDDTAVFHDSSGDMSFGNDTPAGKDNFVAKVNEAIQSNDGGDYPYVLTAKGFRTVQAVSNAGSDRAVLNDSPGNDRLSAWPRSASLADAVSSYSIAVNGFRSVIANSSAGSDQALLYDSSGNDVFVCSPASSKMSGSGYENEVKLFKVVTAYASKGDDVATLYDSAANDVFLSTPSYSVLSGPGYSARVSAFDAVYASGSLGTDLAVLYDSPGNDKFVGRPTESTMQGVGATKFLNVARDFEMVRAIATTGIDTAELYDTAGVDILQADRNWVRLYNNATPMPSYYVSGFDRVEAFSSDVAPIKNQQRFGPNRIRDLLILTGTW